MKPKLLTEVTFLDATEYELTPDRIVEGRGGVPLHILGTLRGKMGIVDEPTSNNRRYPSPIMKTNLNRVSEAMAARGVYGELDHPLDGRTKFQRVSHIITVLQLESKILKGAWDILDTPNGRIMSAVCKAGGRMGASLRGAGTTSMGSDGVEDVNDDYKFMAVDGVVDPAAKDSYPKLVAEAKNLTHLEEMVVSYEILLKDFPGLHSEIVDVVLREHREKIQIQVPDDIGGAVEAVRAEFQEKLARQKDDMPLAVLQTIEQFRSEVAEQERRKLVETLDPVLDRGALEDISRVLARRGIQVPEEYEGRIRDLETALKSERDAAGTTTQRYEELVRETGVLSSLAVQASMLIAAERRLGGKSYREAVLGMVGKPDKYATKEEFEKALGAACAEFESKEKEKDDLRSQGAQDQMETERREHREKVAALEKKLGEIESTHETEVEELKRSHEVQVSEFKGEIERLRKERQDALDKTSKIGERYETLYREARRVEREALEDEKEYERKIADLEGRNEKLKQQVEAEKNRVKIERMLTGRPDAGQLRGMIEGITDVEKAAEIIKSAVTAGDSSPRRSLPSAAAAPPGPEPRGVQQVVSEEKETPASAALEEDLAELGVTTDDIMGRMEPPQPPENGGQQ